MAFDSNLKIGVLGGGQLGRMMIQSAIDFNLDIHVLDPDPNAPCKCIATSFETGSLTDYERVMAFGQDKDLLTIEIENVNTQALSELEKQGKKVFPQPRVIELIQNKLHQKKFYAANGIPTAEFQEVSGAAEVAQKKDFLPFVNKLATGGYDGRGVQVIRTEDALGKAFDAPGFVEKLVDFDKELAVIVARNEAGQVQTFPTVEMVFHPEHNLVEYLFSPASISPEIEDQAQQLAKELIEKLDMVGLLAIEMFLTKEGHLLVNEIAPRTHNSGHQTIEGNVTSQFEQHLRAILNWPLGNTDTLIPSAMVNLLGEDGYSGEARYEGMEQVLAKNGVHVHLYGKKLTKPFRKMGHITVANHNIDQLKQTVNFVKSTLKVKA
ncbi:MULTISPECIES: 5-(carboxyamino)imidazole ribonucleotide synthase [unclassified Roseivirga]|uniref:5-(carboxyamino)imidazole ribonucleotide synthase n=1 Tax=unclassified Roseivirga TaxID=2626142 RepID=UPI00257BC800|nr:MULTISPECIES: 5-(carboxyamino)imidazole ribonucleotide synthase [unclassified Roseivirga]MEC7754459.1 5-(carboxyamino)imidazole ribonucleotide synthase [Bacteroidota bacterium]